MLESMTPRNARTQTQRTSGPSVHTTNHSLANGSPLAGLVAAQSRLAQTAVQQCGCVTTEQVYQSGLGRRRLVAMIEEGHLIRRYVGVYVVAMSLAQVAGDPRLASPGLEREAMAAQLALGRDSCACLDTAARLHGLRGSPRWCGSVDMAIRPTGRARRPVPPLRVHARWVGARDTTRMGPLRLTTVARTLADLSTAAPRAQFVPMVEAARHGELISAAEATRFLNAPHRAERGCGAAPHPSSTRIPPASGGGGAADPPYPRGVIRPEPSSG
ncbi:type IV toxin-antitoxin system AbiEi family antitoxin domain-containing protein [Nocardiopsis rhodophaea]